MKRIPGTGFNSTNSGAVEIFTKPDHNLLGLRINITHQGDLLSSFFVIKLINAYSINPQDNYLIALTELSQSRF